MKRHLVTLLLGSTLVAPAAYAQEFSGGLTFGLSKINVSDVNLDARGLSLDGRIAVDLNNGFTLGARYDTLILDLSDFPVKLNGDVMALSARYDVSDAFSAGLVLEHVEAGAVADLLEHSGTRRPLPHRGV